MFFLHRIWNWCSRFRHRCGYGVHSPSDFFLITSVVYEKYHYYAYRVLKERGFPAYLPHYRRKVNRLLFRLVNYFRPKSLIEVGIGNGASIGYMRAACHTMDSVTLKGRDWTKTSRQLEEKLSEVHTLDCLHIGHTPFYKEVFELDVYKRQELFRSIQRIFIFLFLVYSVGKDNSFSVNVRW